MLVGYAKNRARLQYHATLGKLSSQLAHDLRNPLAAIRGAAQYLLVEHQNGQSAPGGGSQRYLDLIVQQTDRIAALINRYQRIGRVEPLLVSCDINEVVESVVRAQGPALGPSFDLAARCHPHLPRCRLDRELLTEALENLIRNAREALGAEGRIEVTTCLKPSLSDGSPGTVVVCVRDNGPGMDARQRSSRWTTFSRPSPAERASDYPSCARSRKRLGAARSSRPVGQRELRCELSFRGRRRS